MKITDEQLDKMYSDLYSVVGGEYSTNRIYRNAAASACVFECAKLLLGPVTDEEWRAIMKRDENFRPSFDWMLANRVAQLTVILAALDSKEDAG